jgi:hypothetical protein
MHPEPQRIQVLRVQNADRRRHLGHDPGGSPLPCCSQPPGNLVAAHRESAAVGINRPQQVGDLHQARAHARH